MPKIEEVAVGTPTEEAVAY